MIAISMLQFTSVEICQKWQTDQRDFKILPILTRDRANRNELSQEREKSSHKENLKKTTGIYGYQQAFSNFDFVFYK